jgi:hypothetical protein
MGWGAYLDVLSARMGDVVMVVVIVGANDRSRAPVGTERRPAQMGRGADLHALPARMGWWGRLGLEPGVGSQLGWWRGLGAGHFVRANIHWGWGELGPEHCEVSWSNGGPVRC